MADRANQDQINATRRPQIIASDAYLNDPIQFQTDVRFFPNDALQDLDPTLPIISYDDAAFAIIDMNANPPQYYSIQMYQTEFTRDSYESVIQKNRTITQLLTTASNA